MAADCNLCELHTNQKILIEALLRKGASFSIIDTAKEIIKVTYQGKTSYLLDRFNEKVPYNWVVLSASKIFVKNLLLENGISVPLGDFFTREYKEAALEYASVLGYPVVLKPDWGSHGDSVFTDIRDEKELSETIDLFTNELGVETKFIIEEYFSGFEHRIFITSKGDYAVLKREPAHIIGNGISTIKEIIDAENAYRINLKKTVNTSYCPLVVDTQVNKHLSRQGLNLDSVLKKDEKVYLRLTSNIAKGGKSHNMTDKVHPSVIEIVKKVASILPLPFMGIDFISKDITKPQTIDTYKIIEVNSSPGFTMHMLPIEGEPVDVAEYVIKVLFD